MAQLGGDREAAQGEPDPDHGMREIPESSMTEHRYRTRQARLYFALAAAIGGFALVFHIDTLGLVLGGAIAGVLAIRGLLEMRAARKSHPKSVVYTDLNAAPPDVQVTTLRRLIPLSIVAFTALSAWTAYDLIRLEQHEVESVRLMVPVSPVYQAFGFWPAVLLWPALGLLLIAKLVARHRTLTRPSDAGTP
jgi:hypothetical protein